MNHIDTLTLLAGCTKDAEGKEPLIEGLRIGHPACMERGTSQWPVCSTPNFGGSCGGRGWVAKRGTEAEVALLRWLVRHCGPNIIRESISDTAYPERLLEHCVTEMRYRNADGEAFAPKEQAGT